MFCAGIDIGYSNFVGYYGSKTTSDDALNDKRNIIKPVGAGPLEYLPRNMSKETNDDYVRINLGKEKWVCGVEPGKLQSWSRELHANYPETDTYKALMLMGLMLSERDVIDKLVTGLPVRQYIDNNYKNSLIERMSGVHQITDEISVDVKSVLVIPQPLGAYIHTLTNEESESKSRILTEGKVVVIDPGFFSLDWIVIEEGCVLSESCGTNTKAMSHMLETACDDIHEKFGRNPKLEKLEKAIRAGKSSLLSFGKSIDIKPFMAEAERKCAAESLKDIQRAMRTAGMDVDAIILTGGGAKYFELPARNIFQDAQVFISSNPVSQNASGFWLAA